ncbi:MAG: GuaB3 family IMP dehydrogenase-related protein [Verrucomicrobia bacterium]|jgi:IMP dehydrogenase|nr:MAG: GuaB3 family IMP dehydrogenase-related protein [Verrucomicrobiota bacterium]MDH4469877.1 GuaB3 family IMP dehydrogenase-related protein [Verrucomicrobiae bacterium]
MGMWIGRNRKARVTYGFDEIALVPGSFTINPEEVDTTFSIPGKKGKSLSLSIPIMASAMDGVVDVRFAIAMGKLGGLAVLNLDGVQTRYEDPDSILAEVLTADKDHVTALLQKMYQEPVRDDLIAKRVSDIKAAGGLVAVSSIPQRAGHVGPIAAEAGADLFVVQSTVSTVRHLSTKYPSLDLAHFCASMPIPVIVGNAVGYEVTLELMECGVSGVLIGVGPGAACTSRGVLGLGVPQVTATVDCAAARDAYYKKTSRYIPIITDGGMSKGGDVCKALACGSDAVMVGSAFAKAFEAPGKGYHWGMATPHANLPRGTRIHVGATGSLEQILFGPAVVDDGSQNLVGAITTCMGNVGASTIKEFQETEIIIAPSIKTEGKLFQTVQNVGMGTR